MADYESYPEKHFRSLEESAKSERESAKTVESSVNPKDLIGATKAPLGLVPPALVVSVAPVMALGAKKYGPYNWRDKQVKLSVYLEAMLRHTLAALDGQWADPESGEPHLAHVAAGVGIVLDAQAIGQLVDDVSERPKGAAPLLLAEQALADTPLPPTKTELMLQRKGSGTLRTFEEANRGSFQDGLDVPPGPRGSGM